MFDLHPELIEKFDVAGPRYTSYPTADRFVDAFGVDNHVLALEQRKIGLGHLPQALSVYVHVPFCESLCYYCACNKIVTKHHDRAGTYLKYLTREIELTMDYLGRGQSVSQLHLGGGTPTFFSDNELTLLMDALRQNFRLLAQGEYSIEVDPRTVNPKRLAHLATLGFNRLSFGIQDFEPAVQKAVHRIQPFEQVQTLMADARSLGFRSLNVDLIYGLPRQTQASFQRTISKIIELRPDRIALYAYAHLPERFKPQRRIDDALLPNAQTKLAIHRDAITQLIAAGYSYIGMDHFALPNDSLAMAKRQGRLHRNFQGYSTHSDCDMISLGVSAIGKMGSTYSQNAKELDVYYDILDRGYLPIVKGLTLTQDDLLRRSVIMAIMCQGYLDFSQIEMSYLINFKNYFAKELERLQEFVERQLLILTDSYLEVTELGWYFVRGIAMVFDRYLQADRTRTQFSKII